MARSGADRKVAPAQKTSGPAACLRSCGRFLADTAAAFVHGDVWVKASALVGGAGYIARRQYAKGVLICLVQAALTVLLLAGLWPSVRKLGTLGVVEQQRVYNPATRLNEFNDYDNSFLILLYGVIGCALLGATAVLWMRNLRNARALEVRYRSGRHVNSFREDLADCLGAKFHRTLLTLPVAGVIFFTVIPLMVMILVAFTNYDRSHAVPARLFTWVGGENFRSLVSLSSDAAFAHAFTRVLAWTLIWAVAATFTCYVGGILLAMFINHRNTRCKRLWRTCFMVAIAVPQFVSLLLVRNFFADAGIVNTLLKRAGITDWLHGAGWIPTANYVPFLTHPAWARPMIILINLWVGVPYQMLIATGVLMNIPRALLESARIDGANAWQSFRAITLPYVLFVTGPGLVSTLVSNVNNFNVIWLLTDGVYTTTDQLMASAGATEVDLLVTWLYRLTQDQQNYKMASTIGVLVFAVCALLTLTAFGRLIRGDKEESFR